MASMATPPRSSSGPVPFETRTPSPATITPGAKSRSPIEPRSRLIVRPGAFSGSMNVALTTRSTLVSPVASGNGLSGTSETVSPSVVLAPLPDEVSPIVTVPSISSVGCEIVAMFHASRSSRSRTARADSSSANRSVSITRDPASSSNTTPCNQPATSSVSTSSSNSTTMPPASAMPQPSSWRAAAAGSSGSVSTSPVRSTRTSCGGRSSSVQRNSSDASPVAVEARPTPMARDTSPAPMPTRTTTSGKSVTGPIGISAGPKRAAISAPEVVIRIRSTTTGPMPGIMTLQPSSNAGVGPEVSSVNDAPSATPNATRTTPGPGRSVRTSVPAGSSASTTASTPATTSCGSRLRSAAPGSSANCWMRSAVKSSPSRSPSAPPMSNTAVATSVVVDGGSVRCSTSSLSTSGATIAPAPATMSPNEPVPGYSVIGSAGDGRTRSSRGDGSTTRRTPLPPPPTPPIVTATSIAGTGGASSPIERPAPTAVVIVDAPSACSSR